MGIEPALQITLSYVRRDGARKSCIIQPIDYFDPLEEWETEYDLDSTPRNACLLDYLTFEPQQSEIRTVEISICNPSTRKRHVRCESKWGNNWISYATDYVDNVISFSEIILEIAEASGDSTQLLKINRTKEDLRIVTHELTRVSESGQYESISLL